MTAEMLVVFGVVAGALVLFLTDRVRVDVVACLAVLALVATGVLTAGEAFAGFGNPALVFLAGLFVLAGALVRTGVLDLVGEQLRLRAGGSPSRTAAACVLTASAISAWLSNAVTAALLVPVVGGLARRTGYPASRVLMPLSFATMLGGVCTLVGTSTNVVVSGQLESLGLGGYGMFELAWVGVPCLLAGLAYLLLVAPRLLAARESEDAPRPEARRTYVGELLLSPESRWTGRTLREVAPREQGLDVLGLVRAGEDLRAALPDEALLAGDLLVVRATAQDLLAAADRAGLLTRGDAGESGSARGDLALVEAMVAPGSTLAGQTLEEARFRHRFGAVCVALYRRGVEVAAKVGRVRLHSGDVLLVQGSRAAIDELADDEDLIVLDDVSRHRARHARRGVALAVFAASLGAGAITGQFAASALAGAVLAVLAGCLTAEEAHEAIDWRLLILVGGMFAVGAAMTKTGAAHWLADRIVEGAAPLGPAGVLAAFFLLTTLLTQPLSNNAAALVVLPVALAAADPSGVPVRQLAVTVTVAASCSFLTPLEPASLLVWGPGRYRFRDFTLVGLPLTVLVFLLTLLVVPLAWG